MRSSLLILLISIHAPHAEGDFKWMRDNGYLMKFQSTPPMRRATSLAINRRHTDQFQSTPPMRRATKK